MCASFLKSEKERCALVLNGYAGTGKTTLLGTLSNYLQEQKRNFLLMAPTGRAAKVLSTYAQERAFTIHKVIYTPRKRKNGGRYFALRKNTFKNAVFIVDEVSMIGEDTGGLTRNGLLHDLMSFVFSSPGCRLIMVGDEAQLPPVGSNRSPALDLDYLKLEFDLTIAKCSLNTVVRQASLSGILKEATKLREQMLGQTTDIAIKLHKDVRYLSGYEFADHYQESVSAYGEEAVIYITRSNKHANRLNQQIRSYVHQSEAQLDGGDRIMVVKNNYHWTAQDTQQDFIANGDFAEVLRVRNWEDAYGYHYAEATLLFSDYNLELDAKIWLDSFLVDQASMPQGDVEKVWTLLDEALLEEYPDKKARNFKLKENPYVQALQAKFGYAVTCHKAQGGQWPVVYIDLGYITPEQMDKNLLRWLYTALTRATERVYLVNFPEDWLVA